MTPTRDTRALIVALGNPGDRYRDTRHNVGWWLADRLVRGWDFGPFVPRKQTAWTSGLVGRSKVEVHKPQTYMNRSGEAVAALRAWRDFDPAEDLLVLVDDVALEPGRIRLRAKGSAGGHNGLASLEGSLGTDEYARLRLGVGRPHDARIDLAAWVLARMSRADEEAVLAAFPRAVEAVEHWLEHGIEAAMSRFNAN